MLLCLLQDKYRWDIDLCHLLPSSTLSPPMVLPDMLGLLLPRQTAHHFLNAHSSLSAFIHPFLMGDWNGFSILDDDWREPGRTFDLSCGRGENGRRMFETGLYL